MVTINPQFEVVPFSYVANAVTSTGYLIQMINSGPSPPNPVGTPSVPDPTIQSLGYPSYAAMIAALSLQAVKNLTAYPYAYVIGTGANYWATDAAAQAAAIADCNAIVAKRNAIIAASGINAANPFVTLGAPILGPI